jgi:DNA replication initiation complex subunit (GINS family)
MKRIVLVIYLALAGQAWAQAQKPAAPQEPAKPMAAQETPKPAAQASAKPRKPNPKRAEDARHCLEQPSNTDIIKCAEEYL